MPAMDWVTLKEARQFFTLKKGNAVGRVTRLIASYQEVVDGLTHVEECEHWGRETEWQCDRCGEIAFMLGRIRQG